MRKNLENLIKEGLLQKERTGFDQIRKRLARSKVDLENAKKIFPKDKIGAYRAAYDAMLQAGIALILSHGLRPKIRNFHKNGGGMRRPAYWRRIYFDHKTIRSNEEKQA